MTSAFVQAYESLQNRCLRARDTSEIAVLETALDLLLRNPDLEGDAQVLAWNAVREARKSHQRRGAIATITPSVLQIEAQTVEAAVDPAADFTAVETADWIGRAPIEVRDRNVLTLMVDGASRQAIAGAIGVTAGNLKVIVNRLRARAQAHLAVAA